MRVQIKWVPIVHIKEMSNIVYGLNTIIEHTLVNFDDMIHIISANINNNKPSVSLWDRLCILFIYFLATIHHYGMKTPLDNLTSYNITKQIGN